MWGWSGDGLKVGVRGRGAAVSGGADAEIGIKRPAVRARGSVFRLRTGATGHAGMRSPVTAGTAKGSGAVSGVGKVAQAAYAAGTRALATFGKSVQPSVC